MGNPWPFLLVKGKLLPKIFKKMSEVKLLQESLSDKNIFAEKKNNVSNESMWIEVVFYLSRATTGQ